MSLQTPNPLIHLPPLRPELVPAAATRTFRGARPMPGSKLKNIAKACVWGLFGTICKIFANRFSNNLNHPPGSRWSAPHRVEGPSFGSDRASSTRGVRQQMNRRSVQPIAVSRNAFATLSPLFFHELAGSNFFGRPFSIRLQNVRTKRPSGLARNRSIIDSRCRRSAVSCSAPCPSVGKEAP